MSQKRSPKKRRPYRPARKKRHAKEALPLSSKILAFLQEQGQIVPLKTLVTALALPKQDQQVLHETLTLLERTGKVCKGPKGWKLPDATLRATLSLTTKGFGFAVLEGQTAKQQKDIFIPAHALNGAGHGDRILVRLLNASSNRPEGEVVALEKRAFTHLCGIYMGGRSLGSVTPDNDKLALSVGVRPGDSCHAEDGQAVLVEILDYGSVQRQPRGRVLEVLGPPESFQVQIRMALQHFDLSTAFPPEVLAAAEALVPLSTPEKGRKDLRHLRHITIDGSTAKDFDDALAVQKNKEGYRLFVSIADVSYYVQPNSAIDLEAYRRGTSVYLPDLVLPMLPERLSNDLCSLIPDQDRPAFTAILDFDMQGRRTKAQFVRSMIHNYRRFTYDQVHEAAYLKDQAARREHKSFLPLLEKAKDLAALLSEQRRQRGSLGFTLPEAEIVLKEGEIHSVTRLQRNPAHILVEEFMLAANEAVAERLDQTARPVLFRVHEEPDSEKVADFKETAKILGLSLPQGEINPAWFAQALARSQGSPLEYVVNNLLLRTMQRARYTPENLGHFGLAAQYYLHFTSPIRRYPDLVVHRALQALLTQEPQPHVLPQGIDLETAGSHLSARERAAIDVERNVQARLASLFLRQRVGEDFAAVISGVTSFGLFVELLDCLVSGAIPIREMEDDFYHYDTTQHRLLGERTGKHYRLGDTVQVRLERVDMLSKKLTFSLGDKALRKN